MKKILICFLVFLSFFSLTNLSYGNFSKIDSQLTKYYLSLDQKYTSTQEKIQVLEKMVSNINNTISKKKNKLSKSTLNSLVYIRFNVQKKINYYNDLLTEEDSYNYDDLFNLDKKETNKNITFQDGILSWNKKDYSANKIFIRMTSTDSDRAESNILYEGENNLGTSVNMFNDLLYFNNSFTENGYYDIRIEYYKSNNPTIGVQQGDIQTTTIEDTIYFANDHFVAPFQVTLEGNNVVITGTKGIEEIIIRPLLWGLDGRVKNVYGYFDGDRYIIPNGKNIIKDYVTQFKYETYRGHVEFMGFKNSGTYVHQDLLKRTDVDGFGLINIQEFFK